MKKPMITVLILVVLVSVGIYANGWYQQRENHNANSVFKIYGTIDIRDLSLAFNEQERITEVLVEEGARVSQGQVLARLNSDKLKATIAEVTANIGAQTERVKRLQAGSRPQEIDQARAEVEAAQTQVANRERLLSRLDQTVESGATSVQTSDDAQSLLQVEKAQLKIKQQALSLMIEGPRKEEITMAERQLEALQAKLDQLNIRLTDMTLTAPTKGIIQSRILEPGEIAGPQRPVMVMALTDPKWVRAYVTEQDLGRIRLGLKAQVLSDSLAGQPVDGWVGFISPVAEFTPRTVQTEELRTKLVYAVRVFVADPEDRLRLGMPVSVIIDTEERETEHPAVKQGA
ncbi:HlyD family secretion protein [Desulfuromusa kysingii]|uniref:HlyD family secretion protein n=1 Tax=Desulfuromusa kysingii TaxID=37625 RepID=A0A1H4BMA1_9BACT|nr:efflux RND transporter periplasmic adaptor subunit [Desulfuromusa kysingii]SEA49178.1 HlyD family secretion protein [Desulfuromusa kysingii]